MLYQTQATQQTPAYIIYLLDVSASMNQMMDAGGEEKIRYEVEMELFHIPEFVPFIGDKDVVVKGELGLGTLGYDFKLGKETGLYVGDGYGLGATIKFED